MTLTLYRGLILRWGNETMLVTVYQKEMEESVGEGMKCTFFCTSALIY